jgi:hypothetical protein
MSRWGIAPRGGSLGVNELPLSHNALLVCHAWEGGHLYIDTLIGRTTAVDHTELRRNGTCEDSLMRANDQVHLSPKAVPLAESRVHPIIIESPFPPQHEGAIGWSAAAYMDVDIGGAITARHKGTDIKGRGSGRIRHEHEVSPAGVSHSPGRLKITAQIVKAECGSSAVT